MKKIVLLALALCFCSFQLNTLEKVQVDKIPTTVEEFIAFRDKVATTPEGGDAAFVVATIMYVQNPAVGRNAIIIQSDKSLLEASDKGYKGFDLMSSQRFLLTQLDQKKYVPNSYILGTSNANGYALPTAPYNIEVTTNPSSKMDDGQMKMFVTSTGADSPRPIRLKKNDKGVWKAAEYSSLFVGVRAPVVKSTGAKEGDF